MKIFNYNSILKSKIARLEALSDGVFAIALTLLVLDIKVPVTENIHTEKDLIKSFLTLGPKFLAYLLSFITLGIYWIAQSTQSDHMKDTDRNVVWINLFFLLSVSMMPFSTAFLSEHIDFKFAIFVYWVNLSLLGLFLGINWRYVKKHDFATEEKDAGNQYTRAVFARIYQSQLFYTIGSAFCFVDNYLALVILIIIQLHYSLGIFDFLNRRK